jgi:8-oxo-dGTP diphosphatase
MPPAADAPIVVVAALIEREGKLLVCQRRRDARFPLQWEFPGGKVQPGESPGEALRRELAEELGVEARVGREVHRLRYRYPEDDCDIELIFLEASLDADAVRNLAFEEIRWVERARLPELDFLDADREFVHLLAEERLSN